MRIKRRRSKGGYEGKRAGDREKGGKGEEVPVHCPQEMKKDIANKGGEGRGRGAGDQLSVKNRICSLR